MPSGDSLYRSFEQLAEEFATRQRQGENPSIAEYALKFPQWADQIEDLFPLLVVCENVGALVADDRSPVPDRIDGPKQLGEYRILRWIGQGGMGAVYEAIQESLGRHVALKVLWNHRLSHPILLQRFHVEARAAARLHHTNIVPVFDVGEEQGVHFYAMQFIRGQSLDRVIEELRSVVHSRAKQSSERLDARDLSSLITDSLLSSELGITPGRVRTAPGNWEADDQFETPSREDPAAADCTLDNGTPDPESRPRQSTVANDFHSSSPQNLYRNVASIGLQLAEALAYAHGQGIVHRDIKPSNILLDTEGRAWITDFGLAKSEGSDVLTATGDVVGTLRYMSPERFRGQSDVLGDVYGMAVTLYELLTGQPAFQGVSHAQLLLQITSRDPVAPRAIDRKIPADLETIILKGMDKSPHRRYSSAAEMANDLRCFLEGKPIRARRIGNVERLFRWSRRQPALALSASLLLLAATAGFPAVTWLWQRAERFSQAETIANTQLATNLYFSRIAEVDRDLRAHHIQRALDLLDNCPEDLRGWEWYYLYHCWLTDPMVFEDQRSGDFLSVAACPGSSLFALARGDGGVSILNAISRKVELELPKQTANVFSVAFSPNGRFLATASADGKVRVWRWRSGQLCDEFEGHKGSDYGTSHAIAFSPDGAHLCAGDSKGNVHLRDVVSGRSVATFGGSPAIASSVAFSADGSLLAIGRFDGSVRIYNLRVGQAADDEPASVAPGRAYPISDLLFSPDGSRLYGSCFDGGVWVWNAVSGSLKNLSERQSQQPTLSLALSRDGRRLASCGMDKSIVIWDTSTGRDILTLEGHTEMATSLAFSPDDTFLVSTSADRTARIFSTARPTSRETLVIEHGAQVFDADFDATGERIATAAYDGIVRIFNAATGNTKPERQIAHESQPVFGISFSRDGARLATISGRQTRGHAQLNIWSLRTGAREVAPIDVGSLLFDIAFSPDDRYLVAAGRGKKVMVVDSWSGKVIEELTGHEREIYGLSFNGDGTILASKGNENVVILWDMRTLKPDRRIPIPTSNGRCVRISPNGQWLVTAGDGYDVDIRDAKSGKVLQSLHGHTGDVWTADFSRDGRFLATSGDDCTIRIWDSGDGDWNRTIDQAVCALRGHTGFVSRVSFSPNGRRIISAGRGDNTVRIWDVDRLRSPNAPLQITWEMGSIATSSFSD